MSGIAIAATCLFTACTTRRSENIVFDIFRINASAEAKTQVATTLLTINHDQLSDLGITALHWGEGMTRIEIKVAPKIGTRLELASADLQVRACGDAKTTTMPILGFTGAGDSALRPPTTAIVGAPYLSGLARYAYFSHLPIDVACVRVKFPDLLINNVPLVLGEMEFRRRIEVNHWTGV